MNGLIQRYGMRLLPLTLSLAGAVVATGCAGTGSSFWPQWATPYKVEVVQGNVVTREMAAQLREGLTRDQVRSLLGSPLLTDIFHADRWDYVFTIRRQGAEPQSRRVTVYFAGDRIQRFTADELPSENDFVDSIDTAKVKARKKPLVLSDEQLQALPMPAPRRVPDVPDAAGGAARTYPPLESNTR